MASTLEEIYNRLLNHFGPQHWWPGDTPFEVMVGAVLTQNTNWENVSRAINNLKDADVLTPEKMGNLPIAALAELIRPAGYYNLKAQRLSNLLFLIDQQENGLKDLLSLDTSYLRELLLSVKGIGPETADSILLYAAQRPVFVVDTYTYRVLSRHNLIEDETGYYEMQDLFIDNLQEDEAIFNEYHALLVQVGKKYCKKKKPDCARCPLDTV